MLTITPVFNKQNELINFVGIQKDITERKKMELELKNKNEELQQFSYITAHDLRAPIANIKGLIGILNTDTLDIENQSVIDHIERVCLKMDDTIRDLLGVLSLKNDERESENEDVDLKKTLNEIQADLENEIIESGAMIEGDFEELKFLHARPVHIKSVLYNLLSNAIKYKSQKRTPMINVSSKIDGNLACITVRDNGIGLDMELFKNKIFSPFRRFHTHVDGKGIGLYIIKSIAELNGGKVEVESQPGEGTTFNVYFRI